MNINKLYSLFGITLLSIAGGIVGFFTAGLIAIIPGIIIGSLSGYFFDKILLKTPA
jgi:hypothetical protein